MSLTDAQIEQILDGAPKDYPSVIIEVCGHPFDYCHDDDIHHLDDLQELLTLRKRVGELEAQVPKWISVEDELPSKCKYNDLSISVLVYNEQSKCKYTAIYDYKQKDWFCFNSGQILYFGVTHWMPLPQPPKEQGDE